MVVLGPVASSPTDFQMIRHQVLPSNPNHFERVNVNNPPAPAQQPQNVNRVQPQLQLQPLANRNLFGESSRQRREVNRVEDDSNRPNNHDEMQNRLQRNLQMRSRRHESDHFNLPKRFNDSSIPVPYDRNVMAAFNVNNENAASSTSSPRERRLQALRRMEERFQSMRQVNPPCDQIEDQVIPQKRVKRNCIGLFVCDISNILLADDPFIEWIEHKNFGHIANAPERLILSSLVAGNGELIMFGGLRKESLSKSTNTTQVSNAIHFLSVPKEII